MNIISRKLAQRIASKSAHGIFRHAAIVIRGGAIVAMAANSNTIHAEERALQSLWPSEREGTKVWSLRFTKTGKLAMAKPCPNCEKYMRDMKVKTVYYSDSNGEMHKMKL